MERTEIVSKVTDIMRDVFEDDSLAATEATSADDIAEWDSVNHVGLMVAVESEFGIMFDPQEITAPENVGQLVDLIQSKRGG